MVLYIPTPVTGVVYLMCVQSQRREAEKRYVGLAEVPCNIPYMRKLSMDQTLKRWRHTFTWLCVSQLWYLRFRGRDFLPEHPVPITGIR
jgi:hypothetical protein